MREEFYRIYEEITRAYTALPRSKWPQPRRLASTRVATQDPMRLAETAIHASIRNLGLGDRVRPDAKHFLLVNMHQMVSLPILLEASSGRIGDTYEGGEADAGSRSPLMTLRSDLEHDSELILSTASSMSPGEISGRAVLQAVAQVYDRLKTAANNAWG